MMSLLLALPSEGHLEQVLHIFAYLKKYCNTEMVFDTSDPLIDESLFENQDCASSEQSRSLKEPPPPNMSESRGLGFIMSTMVDADHAVDTTT